MSCNFLRHCRTGLSGAGTKVALNFSKSRILVVRSYKLAEVYRVCTKPFAGVFGRD